MRWFTKLLFMNFKAILIRLYWFSSSQIGFNPRLFVRFLCSLPRFLKDWRKFRGLYSGPLTLMPCLQDFHEEGGITKSEYFWQDLLVARWIAQAKPERHVDVGSRVDGFVAHVASFREIEVFDVRPITTVIPGVVFKQADLMRSMARIDLGGEARYCDSLSCLHALEHFGLGRYGDPIDPLGHLKGIANMANLLKPGGAFYLSTPIGRERVEFNANRVFDPRTIVRVAEANGLALRALTIVSGGQVKEVKSDDESLLRLAEAPYHLGIFTFVRH